MLEISSIVINKRDEVLWDLKRFIENIEKDNLDCILKVIYNVDKNAVIYYSEDESFVEQVHFPYRYVNLAGPEARVWYSCMRHDLSLILIFVTSPDRERTVEAGRPLSSAIKQDAHIFGSPHNIRGDDGYACFSVCCHSCCTWCPGVHHGGSPDPT